MRLVDFGVLDIITAAGEVGLDIIPLAWTLPIHAVGQTFGPNDTFLIQSVPRIEAVTQVISCKLWAH